MNSSQRSRRNTTHKIGFVAFWTLVAGGVCYAAFEMLASYGLDWRAAAIVAGFVFICVVIFVTRYDPR